VFSCINACEVLTYISDLKGSTQKGVTSSLMGFGGSTQKGVTSSLMGFGGSVAVATQFDSIPLAVCECNAWASNCKSDPMI
jgi:hypothetical protein